MRPNFIGVINNRSVYGLVQLADDELITSRRRGSIVSQSGGTAVTAHARAQELGLGFRVTISCGNEATLSIGDFIHALAHDDGRG